jgi:predicted N-acetyltransferase YhbS
VSRSTRLVRDEDLPAVAAFLRRAFAETDTSGASVETLRWKYLQAGPPWNGSRAFIVEQDDEIVAHAGFIPALFLSHGKKPVSTVVVTDWAADPAAPGVGVALYARVIRAAESAFLIGGVEVTRLIVPKLGFRPFADATIRARWIRPWREFRQREMSVRALQRLAHGVLHLLRNKRLVPGRWVATKVDAFDARIEPVLAFQPARRTVFQRTIASLNHMLACPSVEMRGYLLRDESRVRGYAILAYLGWEARLIDISIDSERPEDWTAAYGAAAAVARLDPGVCRIRAMTAVPEQNASLERNGFWINQSEPFLLFGSKVSPPELPLDVQFFESDLGYV